MYWVIAVRPDVCRLCLLPGGHVRKFGGWLTVVGKIHRLTVVGKIGTFQRLKSEVCLQDGRQRRALCHEQVNTLSSRPRLGGHRVCCGFRVYRMTKSEAVFVSTRHKLISLVRANPSHFYLVLAFDVKTLCLSPQEDIGREVEDGGRCFLLDTHREDAIECTEMKTNFKFLNDLVLDFLPHVRYHRPPCELNHFDPLNVYRTGGIYS